MNVTCCSILRDSTTCPQGNAGLPPLSLLHESSFIAPGGKGAQRVAAPGAEFRVIAE
jgi:hypothetical protein